VGDRLQAGIPSRHVTSHPGELSLLPSAGRKMSTGQKAVKLCGYDCTYILYGFVFVLCFLDPIHACHWCTVQFVADCPRTWWYSLLHVGNGLGVHSASSLQRRHLLVVSSEYLKPILHLSASNNLVTNEIVME